MFCVCVCLYALVAGITGSPPSLLAGDRPLVSHYISTASTPAVFHAHPDQHLAFALLLALMTLAPCRLSTAFLYLVSMCAHVLLTVIVFSVRTHRHHQQQEQVPANLLLVKNTTMHGIFWGSYMQHDYRALAGGMREVLAWVGEGKLQLEVSHR